MKAEIEESKEKSMAMGLPGPERNKPKLFQKQFEFKPDITAHDTGFSHYQYMMTQDGFPIGEDTNEAQRHNAEALNEGLRDYYTTAEN